MIQSITKWLYDSGRKYQDGVALLEQYCNNAHMIREFANRSPRFAMDDLVEVLSRINNTTSAPSNDPPQPSTANKLPREVVEAKKKIHELWVAISKLTESLYTLGEENIKEIVNKRKKILEDRSLLIKEYNQLYEAKEEYFRTGQTPSLAQPPKEAVDHSDIKDLDLLKALKAAKQYINRYTNQLKYQQNTKGRDNPMPQCPRRTDIEKKLADKEIEYNNLNQEYERRFKT